MKTTMAKEVKVSNPDACTIDVSYSSDSSDTIATHGEPLSNAIRLDTQDVHASRDTSASVPDPTSTSPPADANDIACLTVNATAALSAVLPNSSITPSALIPSDAMAPPSLAQSVVPTLLDPAHANDPIVVAKASAVLRDADMVLADANLDPTNVRLSTDTTSHSTENDSTEVNDPGAPANDSPMDSSATKSDLFSRQSVAKLQEKIPLQYFPDTLIVHDPKNVSMCCDDREYSYATSYDPDAPDFTDDEDGTTLDDDKTAFVYKRVYPAPATSTATMASGSDVYLKAEGIAHLYMDPEHRTGVGHHSHVYLSPLTLPEPLTTFKSASARPGTVLVAAKMAVQQRNARELLASEAATYNSFPQHLSEEYCGFHRVKYMRSLTPSCAVVPKFYGYYVPVCKEHEQQDGDRKQKFAWQTRSPILLMEDCGRPIEVKELVRLER